MKPYMPLAAIFFASASFSMLAQQPTTTQEPGTPAGQQQPAQQNPPAAEPMPQSNAAASADTSAAPMSAVNGELVSKLDSKTAKPGDNVVVQTKGSVKTADGTEVPDGSKLVGHVLAVQATGQGAANSQLVLQLDHVELKGGQSLPVHSQIQSIAPPEGGASASGSATGAMNGTPAGSATQPTTNPNQNQAPGTSSAASSAPAAGTVVAKNGNIAIETTSIPGVLLANNAPGQQDPRMARASSILLGAKKDIQLDSGTQVVVGISAAAAKPAQ
jgi:hypothetical protein